MNERVMSRGVVAVVAGAGTAWQQGPTGASRRKIAGIPGGGRLFSEDAPAFRGRADVPYGHGTGGGIVSGLDGRGP